MHQGQPGGAGENHDPLRTGASKPRLFLQPDILPSDWNRNGFWDKAAALPGVQVYADANGRKAKELGPGLPAMWSYLTKTAGCFSAAASPAPADIRATIPVVRRCYGSSQETFPDP